MGVDGTEQLIGDVFSFFLTGLCAGVFLRRLGDKLVMSVGDEGDLSLCDWFLRKEINTKLWINKNLKHVINF